MLGRGDSYKKIEKIIHNDFKCYRTYGEWFDLSKVEYLNEILNCGEVKYIDDIIIQDGDYFLDICKGYSRFDKEPEMYDINDYEYLLYLIKNNDDNEYFHNYIVKPYSKIEKYINSLYKNIVLLNKKKKQSYIDLLTEEEIFKTEEIVRSWADKLGIDIKRELSLSNKDLD